MSDQPAFDDSDLEYRSRLWPGQDIFTVNCARWVVAFFPDAEDNGLWWVHSEDYRRESSVAVSRVSVVLAGGHPRRLVRRTQLDQLFELDQLPGAILTYQTDGVGGWATAEVHNVEGDPRDPALRPLVVCAPPEDPPQVRSWAWVVSIQLRSGS